MVPASIRLERVRVMCIGKHSESKGRGKGKGKSDGGWKGKTKGKGKGWSKDKSSVTASQYCQPVYLGDTDGYILCLIFYSYEADMHFGVQVHSLVDISGLKPRLGQPGILSWSEESVVRAVLDPHHAIRPAVFGYPFEPGADFATMEYIRDCTSLGDFVALVCRVIGVAQKSTSWGEPYAELQAIDMGRERVTLRLWLFVAPQDICDGMFCIIRGLKVAAERSGWDDWSAWSYQGEPNPRRALEYVRYRTAVEDVSHVDDIRAIFVTSF